MPSFDVVSEYDSHEASNAIDQANREIDTRFDFRGSDASFVLENENIQLEADNEFQLQQMLVQKFTDYLDDENVYIRRKCVVLMGDFTGRKDFKTLNLLEQVAASDKDWKVRYFAWQAIQEASPERAKRVKLPLSVRLRARFSDTDDYLT